VRGRCGLGYLLDHRRSVRSILQGAGPRVRGGPAGAGGPIAGLTDMEKKFFAAGLAEFSGVEGVIDGLRPRMNLNSCAGCHAQPATGGTSPFVNPQVAFATKDGGINQFPSAVIFSGGYMPPNGPVREVRFKFNPDGTRDGGVHNTATITGRTGASGCLLTVDDINGQFAAGNAIFRIPTPVFGAGLIEQIPDKVILANQAANSSTKSQLGIGGRANRHRPGRASGEPNNNGNDGTVARFGWKAQNKSLLLFSGEAYNVEMGISNELFQQEREEKASCQFVTVPNDFTDPAIVTTPAGLSSIEKFAFFQRFLAPPTPSPDTPGGATSINNGRMLRWRPCGTSTSTFSRTFCSTTWDRAWLTISSREGLEATSSGPRRCGVWDSASSSCTTDERTTCSTRSRPIGAPGTPSSGRRRRT
jgi:hypothetical protein